MDQRRIITQRLLRQRLAQGERIRLQVSGESMSPLMHDGDSVVVVPVEAARLKRGQIVVVSARDSLLIHRVMVPRNAQGQLVTRGDAHRYNDQPASASQLLGQAIRLLKANGEEIDLTSEAQGRRGLWIYWHAKIWEWLKPLRDWTRPLRHKLRGRRGKGQLT